MKSLIKIIVALLLSVSVFSCADVGSSDKTSIAINFGSKKAVYYTQSECEYYIVAIYSGTFENLGVLVSVDRVESGETFESEQLPAGLYCVVVTAFSPLKEIASGYADVILLDGESKLVSIKLFPNEKSEEEEYDVTITVSSAADLLSLSASSNGDVPEDFAGVLINIESDISITSGWTPISSKDGSAFKGTINGNGHRISVPMTGFQNGEKGVAGLVGVNEGIIENIEYYVAGYSDDGSEMISCDGSEGSNIWWGYVGPFAAINRGTIRNCWNRVNFMTPYHQAGGIAGWNNGTIENCVNTGNIVVYNAARNQPSVGGIAGNMDDRGTGPAIINCVNYGNVGLREGYSQSRVACYAGAICGTEHYISENTSHVTKYITNCYYMASCVELDDDTNSNIIYYFSETDRNLVVSGCGTINDSMTITAGIASSENSINCVTAQTLNYGSNLQRALNGYVSDNPSHRLTGWKTSGGMVLLDF